MLAIVVAIAAASLGAGLRAWRAYDTRQDLHRDVRAALALLGADLASSLPLFDEQVLFAPDEIAFWVRRGDSPDATLCRWRSEDATVTRSLTGRRGARTGESPFKVSERVREARFSYLVEGNWEDSVPRSAVPDAVRLTLVLADGEEQAMAYTAYPFVRHHPPDIARPALEPDL